MNFADFEFKVGDLVVVRGSHDSGITTFLGGIFRAAQDANVSAVVLDDFHHDVGGYSLELRRFVAWKIEQLRKMADCGQLVVVCVVDPKALSEKRPSVAYNDGSYDFADVIVSVNNPTKPSIWRQRRTKGKLS